MKQLFILTDEQVRQRVCDFIMQAPQGYVVEIKEPTRNLEQNAKFHSMIMDISKQVTFLNQKWNTDDWKRLLLFSFAKLKEEEGNKLSQGVRRVMPGLDGTGIVQLGIQSSKLTKAEASEFIEYLYAYGAEKGVKWTDEK